MSDSQNLRELLVRPAQLLFDRGVQQSETARALCQQLEGRTFALQTGIAKLDVFFAVHNGKLQVLPGQPEDADATLIGSPLMLARLAGEDPQAIIRSGDVSISGDTEIAEDFQTLLFLMRPDFEEELSRFTGDIVAHEIGNGIRSFKNWLRRADTSFTRSMGEYLNEESRVLVGAAELEEFYTEVDDLSSAVDRADAKFKWLCEQRATL